MFALDVSAVLENAGLQLKTSIRALANIIAACKHITRITLKKGDLVSNKQALYCSVNTNTS